MMAGPKVNVFVGTSKDAVSLPIPILSYYSEYFEELFKVKNEKGRVQMVNLPDDDVSDFKILVDFMLMLHGTVPPSLKATGTPQQVVKRCMDFLEYADKYKHGAISDVVYEPLKAALTMEYGCFVDMISTSQIELVFRIAPAGSRVRSLIAQAVLSRNGIKALGKVEKQYMEVEGFASELLRQIISTGTAFKWTDPLINCPSRSQKSE
jgi:hypothetical protein